MQSTARAFLKRGRVRPFLYRHPWVFSGAIDRIEGEHEDGCIIDLADPSGTFIARGLYNSRSQILIRLYTWQEDQHLDRDFFSNGIRKAIDYRKSLQEKGLVGSGEACRLINSEGDGLSGLVLDAYPPFGVVQFMAMGLDTRRAEIIPLLAEFSGLSNIYERSDGPICSYEGLEARTGPVFGDAPPPTHSYRENGLEFIIDLRRGHKTGTYLDQRENHARTAEMSMSGKVLDVFSYTGAFGIHAARSGASVLAIDESGAALEMARKNAAANGLADDRYDTRRGPADIEMRKLHDSGDRFGTVILDPPKFAHSRNQLPRAIKGYQEINRLGIQLLEADGLLITCSCSGAVDAAQFQEVLHESAYQAGRDLQVIEIRSQSLDHPVALACPESRYLKCFVCLVG